MKGLFWFTDVYVRLSGLGSPGIILPLVLSPEESWAYKCVMLRLDPYGFCDSNSGLPASTKWTLLVESFPQPRKVGLKSPLSLIRLNKKMIFFQI